MERTGNMILVSTEEGKSATYKLPIEIQNASSNYDDYSQRKLEPCVLNLNAGEDIMEKLTCFFKESEGMLICATGLVAKASIRHHRLVEYEGRFEILSLSGSFLKTSTGMKPSVSIQLAKADHETFGGSLAGKLIAASPIQVVVAHFR